MKVSFLITPFKEQATIAQCLVGLIDLAFLELNLPFEILLACPDQETHLTAKNWIQSNLIEKTNFENFFWIKDPQQGKPIALNLLFQKATGEILIQTDGDVFPEKKASYFLIQKLQQNPNLKLISGKPKATNPKTNFWGYFGNFLADVANLRRQETKFFPASGYLLALRPPAPLLPSQVLSDDAYLSYLFLSQNQTTGYQPKAEVKVKYPTNLKDFFKQKRRSVGGFSQLKQFPEFKNLDQTRSFWIELKYTLLPLKYATNLKELLFSIGFYPIRFWLWILIFWDRKILKKDFESTWQRVESTK